MKGIMFQEPLFHLTIQGIKKQTRRIIKPQPDERGLRTTNVPFEDWHGKEVKPRYKVGDIVYLKEPYFLYEEMEYLELKTTNGLEIAYKYGDYLTLEEITGKSGLKWKNKLFMPEWAARHFIKITAVRAERLQDISEEDCISEGIMEETPDAWGMDPDLPSYWTLPEEVTMEWFKTPQEAYAFLIDKINGAGTWESNPWVYVYDYELLK